MYFQFNSRIYEGERKRKRRRRITGEAKVTYLYNIERKNGAYYSSWLMSLLISKQ
jgi:hypothetical protein